MQMNQARGYQNASQPDNGITIQGNTTPPLIYMHVDNQTLDNEHKIQQVLRKFMPSEAISEEDENIYTMSSQPSPKTIEKQKIILLQLSAKHVGTEEASLEDQIVTQELDESCNLFFSGLKVKQRSRDVQKKSAATHQTLDFDKEL